MLERQIRMEVGEHEPTAARASVRVRIAFVGSRSFDCLHLQALMLRTVRNAVNNLVLGGCL